MQPRLALAEAKLCRGDARERWREPVHVEENTAGEIRPPPVDTPPIYTAPPYRPKAHHHFPPFEISVHSYSPATTVRDGPV
jgi:hypothetical protein